jgi:hypothetical protein
MRHAFFQDSEARQCLQQNVTPPDPVKQRMETTLLIPGVFADGMDTVYSSGLERKEFINRSSLVRVKSPLFLLLFVSRVHRRRERC